VHVGIPSGDTLSLVVNGVAVSAVAVTGQGTYTLDPATGTISFAPDPTFLGPANPVTFRLTDTHGLSGEAIYSPTVYPPAAPAPQPVNTTGMPTVLQSTTIDVPTGGGVTLVSGGAPVTSITLPGEGTYTVDTTTDVITFAPTDGFVGVAGSVTYQVTDAFGQAATSILTAKVLGLSLVRSAPAGAPAGSPLPATGAPVEQQLVVAVVFLLGGTVVLLAGRVLRAGRAR
jgi:CshA-type fibril repeat protein